MISIKKPDLAFTLSLLVVFLLPSFFFVTLKRESLAQGLILASFIVAIINYKELIGLRLSLRRLILYMPIIILVFISASYNYINLEISKPIISFFSLLFVLLSSYIFSVKLTRIRFEALEYSLLIVILLLLCLGWIKIFMPITFGAYASLNKPVFPFSEASHYALSVGLLSVGYAVTARKKSLFLIIINMFLFSLMFPNLTMLLSTIIALLASMIGLRPKYLKIVLLIFPVIIFIFSSMFLMSNSYFSSRLSFEDTNNLTTLVFLQGWYLAFLNTISTNGLGLGFQMLGMPGTQLTPFSDIIESLAGKILNLTDGGLLAAKFIAEFGIVGIILSLVYFVFIIKFLFNANAIMDKIRYTSNDMKQIIQKRLLLYGLLFGFMTEFFFRGYGYFSPGLYLVFAVLISVNKSSLFCKTLCK